MSEIAAAPVVAPPSAETAPAPVVTKAPEAEPKEPMFELEIDGKKTSMTHTQARTELQKRAAADKRMQSATETQKKLDALLAEFEADPEAAMRKAGKDPEKILAALLERKAKQALMTPEQIEAARLAKENADLRAESDKTKAEKKAEADKLTDEANREAVQSQLVEAADRYKLDATPETLEGLADVAVDLIDYLGRAPSIDQIAQEYMRREAEHVDTVATKRFSKLDGKKLLEYLGNPTVEKVKAALALMDAESLKSIPAPQKKAPPAPKPTTRNDKGQYVTESAFDKKFGL